jgi:hypothetical protein
VPSLVSRDGMLFQETGCLYARTAEKVSSRKLGRYRKAQSRTALYHRPLDNISLLPPLWPERIPSRYVARLPS